MIRQGESVAMAIYWSDPATEQANYAMNAVLLVEYEVDGETWKIPYDFAICRSLLSACEHDLWVFEEMDFEEIHFAQYVDGEWMELPFEINEDGTINVHDVQEGPKVIFIK